MANIWFTSDNHFGHANILKFSAATRRGANAQEMNQMMIQEWQRQVQPEDTVYMLGDVFFCQAHEAHSIMDQLPGQKHLVYGNHDKVIKNNNSLRQRFASVRDYNEFKINGSDIVLFHFPIYEWNKIHYGAYHLFGHVHGNTKVPGRALDVGIDGELANGSMSLFSWEQVDNFLKTKEIRTHH